MNKLEEERKKTDHIKQIRGKGLMVGIVLDQPGKEIVFEMMKQGVLSNCTAKNVIRFVPPLIISEKDIDIAVNVLMKSIKEVFSDEN
jgi:acetylornithine/N-succinyldiaminopimelate aminotransferase